MLVIPIYTAGPQSGPWIPRYLGPEAAVALGATHNLVGQCSLLLLVGEESTDPLNGKSKGTEPWDP